MNAQVQEIARHYEQSLVKLILYSIHECPLPLGINKTIAILRGSKSTFLISYKLHQLDTYGIFPTFTFKYLQTVINILLKQDLLSIKMVSKYENLPTLMLTPKGKDFLAEKHDLGIPFIEKLSDSDVIELNDDEQELFQKLRLLRRKLSLKRHLPAYTICHDTTLREMCKSKPTKPDHLFEIRGIGEKFVQNYGNDFIDAIISYTT